MTSNKTLKTKGMVQNDEFFTKREVVLKQCLPLKKILKGKKIICPCDTKNSEYYKVLHNEWKLDVDLAPPGGGLKHNFFSVDYSKYDFVITNIPFSLVNDFFSLMIKNKCKYSILCPWLFIGNKFFLKNMLNSSFWSASFSSDWKNTTKKVCCRFHTNIKDIYIYTKHNKKLTGKISDFDNVKMKSPIVRTGFHFQDFQCKPEEWEFLQQYAKPGVRSVSCYYLYIPNAPFIKQRIWQLSELPTFIKYLKKYAPYIKDVISLTTKMWKEWKEQND